MRTSQFLLSTLKETPADAEVISHQLMLRAGLVRRLANGLYSWLPLGVRVLRKIETIIREEMNASGAQEVLMPIVQPAELWKESARWEKYGSELLRISDRHQREFCLGPTHEEVITDLMRNELSSYKQLPVNLYQIQTKFRDEIRPRYGVMRAREFIMKDAYSFHLNQDSLQQTYDAMYQTYCRIFTRLGLDFRPVQADTGSIGGNASHEFHVLADAGEDAIAFSDSGDYAANIELAPTLAPTTTTPSPACSLEEIETPTQKSIEQISDFLHVPAQQCLKTLLVKGQNQPLVALVLRGDHQLNEIKAEKHPLVHSPLTFASAEEISSQLHCTPGFIGPVNLADITIIADFAAVTIADFVCGANKTGFHFRGANWQRDCNYADTADLRNITEGEPSPDGKGKILLRRGIEVGHIFQLGQNYSESMQAAVLDEKQQSTIMTMGCYGIGVSRIVAAAIEQHHDDAGIKWPQAIAPFTIALVAINYHKSQTVREYSDQLYQTLIDQGVDVLFFDHKKARLGAILADIELIGIPHRLIIGEKGLAKQELEYQNRLNGETAILSSTNAILNISQKLQ